MPTKVTGIEWGNGAFVEIGTELITSDEYSFFPCRVTSVYPDHINFSKCVRLEMILLFLQSDLLGHC